MPSMHYGTRQASFRAAIASSDDPRHPCRLTISTRRSSSDRRVRRVALRRPDGDHRSAGLLPI